MDPRSGTAETEPRKLVEYAHERLRSAILSGQLSPGETLSQVRLAQEFGVSRTPLREAVRLLEHEGLATVEFNRRVVVSELSAEDLEALYAQRITSESLAIHARAAHLEEAQIERSQELLDRMAATSRSGRAEEWHEAHREFHLGLVLGAGPRMDQQIRHCFDHARRYRHLYLSFDDVDDAGIAEDHTAIHRACSAGDGVAAARALADHYARTARGVLRRLDPERRPLMLDAAVAMSRSLVFVGVSAG